jgi:hypothetical protein
MISVILPVLHDEPALIDTLSALVEAVADGVLRDAILIGPPSETTDRMADAAGAMRIEASGSRDDLILQAARQAKAEWLLIVTPGLVPTGDWIRSLAEFPTSAQDVDDAAFLALVPKRGWRAAFSALYLNHKARISGKPDPRLASLMSKSTLLQNRRPRFVRLEGGMIDRRR